MTSEIKNTEDKKDCSSCEKGNTALIAGAGIGSYGAYLYASAGYICPACLIVTPLLLAGGSFLRYRYIKSAKSNIARKDQGI